MPRKDPLRNFRFRLEIDGIQQAGSSEGTGFDVTVEPIDYREGNDPTHVRKLPGLTKYGNVTLKWGVTDSKELHDWHRQIVDGTIQRKNISIVGATAWGKPDGPSPRSALRRGLAHRGLCEIRRCEHVLAGLRWWPKSPVRPHA